jgi:primary-amine oxidase
MIDDPIQGSTAWLDHFFGMGEFMKDLILQYDYPTESVYLPARTFSILGNVQRWRVICIFERRKTASNSLLLRTSSKKEVLRP